jgi:hypothetical protein
MPYTAVNTGTAKTVVRGLVSIDLIHTNLIRVSDRMIRPDPWMAGIELVLNTFLPANDI